MKKVAIKCKSKKHGKKIVKYFEGKGVSICDFKGDSIGCYYFELDRQLSCESKLPEGYKEIKLPKKKNWVKREIERLEAEVNELKKHPMLNVPELQKTPSPFSSPICILEKKPIIKSELLEKGKWYHNVNIGSLFLFNGEHGKCITYGINGLGEWSKIIGVNGCYEYILATEEEIQSALISEAKKRGFKEGVSAFWNEDITHNNMKGEFNYNNTLNYLAIGDKIIFNDGEWAEVIIEPTQKEKEIDWSIPGQIVSSDTYIVLTSGKEKGTDFGGMVISVKNKILEGRVGFYTYKANKASFKLHKEPITLSN